MNSDELRDLTESYYQGVYSEENIDEDRKKLEAELKTGRARRDFRSLDSRPHLRDNSLLGTPKIGIGKYLNKKTKNRQETHAASRGVKTGSRHLPESQDLYDVVLDHLLSEGYADDARSAAVIMTHMSDEWLGDIMSEAMVGVRAKKN
jgi:DNA modification methylase